LNKDTLRQVVAALKEEKQLHQPFAGMYEMVEGHDEYGYTIKANREGLVELVIALLDAARQDYIHSGPQIIPLDIDDRINPNEDGFLPQRIELTARPYVPAVIEKRKSRASRFLLPAGCLLIFAFVIISLVVGIITVFRWIF
jgi:hypothetical protein